MDLERVKQQAIKDDKLANAAQIKQRQVELERNARELFEQTSEMPELHQLSARKGDKEKPSAAFGELPIQKEASSVAAPTLTSSLAELFGYALVSRIDNVKVGL